MDLMALADFHLVATHGGYGRAARATGRSKATLSRRVAELETSLGLRLFERGGSLALTEDGRSLLAGTRGPLGELDATADALRGRSAEPRGRLRVSTPLLLGQYAMGAIAARFLAAHPLVRLEILAEDRYVDLVQEGYDIAIRANPQPDDDLVGRRFLTVPLLVVAPASLPRPVARQEGDGPKVPAVVRLSGNDERPWTVEDGAACFTVQPDPVLRVSALGMMRDAVLAGAGAALLPRFLVQEHLASGRLAAWGVARGQEVEIWVLHASTRLASSKVRAFVRHLVEAFPDGSIEAAVPHPGGAAGGPA